MGVEEKLKVILKNNGKKITSPFEYSSENNPNFLQIDQIKKIINNILKCS